jgi:hypothetical protein
MAPTKVPAWGDPPDCGDSSCWFALKKSGMRTNGGCRCSDNKGKELERYARKLKQKIDTLYDAIKHGDETHQAWLKEAIGTHFYGPDKTG